MLDGSGRDHPCGYARHRLAVLRGAQRALSRRGILERTHRWEAEVQQLAVVDSFEEGVGAGEVTACSSAHNPGRIERVYEEDQALIAWDSSRRSWQRVLNEHPIPARRLQRTDRAEAQVGARLVWERDGAEWLETVAMAWTSDLVLVRVEDPRRGKVIGVWLSPADVRRR